MAIIAVGMEAIAIVAMGITDRIIGRFTIIRLLATAPLITARPRRSGEPSQMRIAFDRALLPA